MDKILLMIEFRLYDTFLPRFEPLDLRFFLDMNYIILSVTIVMKVTK